jgi:hypothetical protein
VDRRADSEEPARHHARRCQCGAETDCFGAATSIFTLLNALALRPLPLPHPEQLVQVTAIYSAAKRAVKCVVLLALEKGDCGNFDPFAPVSSELAEIPTFKHVYFN